MTRMLIVALALVAAADALAQGAFPTRPVTIVVGFAPGGGTDIVARDHREAARGRARAAGAGREPRRRRRDDRDRRGRAGGPGRLHDLARDDRALAVAPHLNSKLPYDPRRDFAPLTMATVFANVLVVHPSVQAKTLAEFVKVAQAKPGTIAYGTSGIGSTGHLAGELFRLMAKADRPRAVQGRRARDDRSARRPDPVELRLGSVGVAARQGGKDPRARDTGVARSSLLPDVPTIAESYPGYEATNWYAFVAPAKTPKDVVGELNRQLVKVLSTPTVREQLLANGMEPQPSTPEELARYMEREYETWGRVVKEAGIQAE